MTDRLVNMKARRLNSNAIFLPENIIRTVVAFSNGAGGTIIVGVDDRKRSVAGFQIQKQLKRYLPN